MTKDKIDIKIDYINKKIKNKLGDNHDLVIQDIREYLDRVNTKKTADDISKYILDNLSMINDTYDYLR